MDAADLANAERRELVHALRIIRKIRGFEPLPVADDRGIVQHGFEVINRAPMTEAQGRARIFQRMQRVIDELRPRVMPIVELHPEAVPRLRNLYVIGELLNTERMLGWSALWDALSRADWHAAGRELMACKWDDYVKAEVDVRRQVADVWLGLIAGTPS